MKPVQFSERDHDLVSAAVMEAEKQTSGEIVPIVARRSDAYHDVGLHWAIGTVFVALAFFAFFPDYLRDLAGRMAAGELTTVIDRTYPLASIREAHAYVESGHKQGHLVVEL